MIPIPITRKDLYLNKIVGNDDYSVPEKPITEEEFFFAEILGEAVQAPEPLTRYQIYLAKIAGREIEIPYPEVRLEFFLAKAAGMDVETPVPITREEIYWSNYTAIVEFEFEGVPPLTYKTIKGTLKNYCIFGNSVEQVISNNLFYKVISGAGMQTDGTIKSDSSYNMLFAKIIPGQDYIAAKGEVNSTALTYTLYNVYDHDPDIGSQALLPSWKSTAGTGIINYTGDTPVYLGLRVPTSIAFPHLNIGTTICDYDEYETSITGVGDKVTDSQYLIPVTITNGADTQTTNLYLPEPLKMVGDEAEYVDYKEQKQHRVRKNLFDGEIEQGGYDIYGLNVDNELRLYRVRGTNYIPVVGGETYNLHAVSISPLMYHISYYTKNDYTTRRFGSVGWTQNSVFTTPSDCKYIRLLFKTLEGSVITPDDISNVMLNAGSTVLPYEPYIENTDLNVTLPALPTFSGTNTLSVGTTVQPSKVYIKGEKRRD